MSATKQRRLATGLKWAARIIGLGASALFGLALLIGLALQPQQTVEGIPAIIAEVIALTSCIVSWRREGLAGILLVLTSIGLGVLIAIVSPKNFLLYLMVMLLPWLVAGILFLLSWWLSRKTSPPVLPPSPTS